MTIMRCGLIYGASQDLVNLSLSTAKAEHVDFQKGGQMTFEYRPES